MKAYLINLHLLVLRSMSSAKVRVKYRGYISQKMAVSMAFVFHKHILFLMFGWHPRLSIDAYFGNDPPVVKQRLWITPHMFSKLRKRLEFAYRSTGEEATKSAVHDKAKSDKRLKIYTLEPGDRVLVRKAGFTSTHKIAD